MLFAYNPRVSSRKHLPRLSSALPQKSALLMSLSSCRSVIKGENPSSSEQLSISDNSSRENDSVSFVTQLLVKEAKNSSGDVQEVVISPLSSSSECSIPSGRSLPLENCAISSFVNFCCWLCLAVEWLWYGESTISFTFWCSVVWVISLVAAMLTIGDGSDPLVPLIRVTYDPALDFPCCSSVWHVGWTTLVTELSFVAFSRLMYIDEPNSDNCSTSSSSPWSTSASGITENISNSVSTADEWRCSSRSDIMRCFPKDCIAKASAPAVSSSLLQLSLLLVSSDCASVRSSVPFLNTRTVCWFVLGNAAKGAGRYLASSCVSVGSICCPVLSSDPSLLVWRDGGQELMPVPLRCLVTSKFSSPLDGKELSYSFSDVKPGTEKVFERLFFLEVALSKRDMLLINEMPGSVVL